LQLGRHNVVDTKGKVRYSKNKDPPVRTLGSKGEMLAQSQSIELLSLVVVLILDKVREAYAKGEMRLEVTKRHKSPTPIENL
jgi:hypothetical protein